MSMWSRFGGPGQSRRVGDRPGSTSAATQRLADLEAQFERDGRIRVEHIDRIKRLLDTSDQAYFNPTPRPSSPRSAWVKYWDYAVPLDPVLINGFFERNPGLVAAFAARSGEANPNRAESVASSSSVHSLRQGATAPWQVRPGETIDLIRVAEVCGFYRRISDRDVLDALSVRRTPKVQHAPLTPRGEGPFLISKGVKNHNPSRTEIARWNLLNSKAFDWYPVRDWPIGLQKAILSPLGYQTRGFLLTFLIKNGMSPIQAVGTLCILRDVDEVKGIGQEVSIPLLRCIAHYSYYDMAMDSFVSYPRE